MAWNGKKFAGVGCGVLLLGSVVVAGALTWYSTRLSREYKKVQASEQLLVTATGGAVGFTSPAGGVPEPARIEAFAGVREATAEWRRRLATEEDRFAADRGHWWRRLGAADDLAQVLAGFWLARNEALGRAAMSPDEYVWLYGLVYYGWLGHDPAAGRLPGGDALAGGGAARGPDADRFALRRRQWQGGVEPEAAARLEPLRDRLAKGWSQETNPVELIFVADGTAEARPDSAGAAR